MNFFNLHESKFNYNFSCEVERWRIWLELTGFFCWKAFTLFLIVIGMRKMKWIVIYVCTIQGYSWMVLWCIISDVLHFIYCHGWSMLNGFNKEGWLCSIWVYGFVWIVDSMCREIKWIEMSMSLNHSCSWNMVVHVC